MTKSQYKSVKTQNIFFQNEKETQDRQHESLSNSLEITPSHSASSHIARREARCKWPPCFLPQEMLCVWTHTVLEQKRPTDLLQFNVLLPQVRKVKSRRAQEFASCLKKQHSQSNVLLPFPTYGCFLFFLIPHGINLVKVNNLGLSYCSSVKDEWHLLLNKIAQVLKVSMRLTVGPCAHNCSHLISEESKLASERATSCSQKKLHSSFKSIFPDSIRGEFICGVCPAISPFSAGFSFILYP